VNPSETSTSRSSPSETRRRQSVKKLIEEIGFNPLEDLYGLKSMPTDDRQKLLQNTMLEDELKRRRVTDFPQLQGNPVLILVISLVHSD